MRVFVDTSALLAVIDRADRNHSRATAVWQVLMEQEATLVCTSYVLVEAYALLQRRFGMDLVRLFHQDVTPWLDVLWIDSRLHAIGMATMLTANRRLLSLVDCISFVAAKQLQVDAVFAYDEHFVQQGFRCL